MTKKISSFLLYVTVLLLATSLISAPVQSPLNSLLPPVAAHRGPTISEFATPSVSPAQAALGDIIVSDPSANTLFVQSDCASPPCAAPTILFSGTPYVTPEGVAMDSSGNIIVADGSGKIFRQSPSGAAPTLLYSGSPYVSPAGVAIDSSGNIIVADLGAKTIFRQSPSGGAPSIVFSGPPYAFPFGVAIDQLGNIIVADGSGTIFRQSPSGGAPSIVFSGPPYAFPFGVAIDQLGNIIVADGSGTIFRQSPSGGAPTPISSAGYITPQGVATGFPGNIIVTDYGVRAIFVQSNCASPPCAAPTPISSVGYVTPEGVTMDSSGNFIVVDQGGTVGSPAILRQSMSGGAPATLFSGTPYVSPEFDVVLKPLKTAGGCEMAITKTITPNPIQSGGTATITLTLTPTSSADCNGNVPVYIDFIDPMPTSSLVLWFVASQPVSVAGAYGMSCDVTYGGAFVSCGMYTPTLIPYPTQSETVTFSVHVTAPAGSTFPNCAIAYVQDSHNQFFNSNIGCATLTVVGGASGCDLAIAKTMNVSSDGLTVNINLNVSSQGPGACTLDNPLALTVNDTMPTGLTATSAGGAGWTCNLTVICHPSSGGSFPPGWSSTITITAKATGGAGKIENCAHVSFDPDTNQDNNTSCASVTVGPPSCDLAITKTITPNPPPLQIGQTVNVTLTIDNVSKQPCMERTSVQDDLTTTGLVAANVPASPFSPGSGWTCNYSNSSLNLSCITSSPLPAGYSLTFSFQVKVVGPEGSYTNCATVSSVDDHNPANNQSCTQFTITPTSTTSTSSTAGCTDLSTGTNADYQADAPGTLDSTWKVTNPSGNVVPLYSVTPWFTSSGNFWAGYPNTNSDPNNYVGNKANWITTNQASGYPDPIHLALVGMYHYTRTFTVSSPSVLTISAFSADNMGILYISPYSSSSNPSRQTANYPNNPFSYMSLSGPASVSLAPGTYTLEADVNNVDAVVGMFAVASVCPQASPPKCIIATAAYGSDMAAPVQFLRSFRDNEVQKTRLGSSFMQAFNGWYYSWAPSVAQRIAPNENYKAATRAVIAPLIGSLFLGHAVFAALAPLSPELAIVSAGLLASSLIGALYLGLPLAVLRTRIRRLGGLKAQKSLQRILTAALLTALGLMVVGRIISSAPILIMSTSTFVLSTLFLSAAITSGTIAKRFRAEK